MKWGSVAVARLGGAGAVAARGGVRCRRWRQRSIGGGGPPPGWGGVGPGGGGGGVGVTIIVSRRSYYRSVSKTRTHRLMKKIAEHCRVTRCSVLFCFPALSRFLSSCVFYFPYFFFRPPCAITARRPSYLFVSLNLTALRRHPPPPPDLAASPQRTNSARSGRRSAPSPPRPTSPRQRLSAVNTRPVGLPPDPPRPAAARRRHFAPARGRSRIDILTPTHLPHPTHPPPTPHHPPQHQTPHARTSTAWCG